MVLRALLYLATTIIVGAVLLAIVAAIGRRWRIARRAARVAMLALGIEMVAPLLLGLLARVVLHKIAEPLAGGAVEPSERATELARSISEWMNCYAVALLAGLIALPIWFIARRRTDTASSRPDGP